MIMNYNLYDFPKLDVNYPIFKLNVSFFVIDLNNFVESELSSIIFLCAHCLE